MLTIVATVSERHAPPSHANTQLTPIYSHEEVRVLHVYTSPFHCSSIHNMANSVVYISSYFTSFPF